MTSFSIFNWRILIFKSDINYHAKYIACYLSTYMNEHGDNCFPSIDRISHESGVSRPTVIKYIQELKSEGWLESKKKGFDGQSWAHNQYYPNVPKKVVKEINHLLEGGKPHSERQLTSVKKAVNEVDSSSSVNSVDNTTEYIPSPNSVNGVPYQKIVELYHEELPMLARVEKLTPKRKSYIRQRWQQKDIENLDEWKNFFDYVKKSKFLTGGSAANNGHKPFRANLEWLTKESNFIKILEGNYHG